MATPNATLTLAFVKAAAAYVKKANAELETHRKAAAARHTEKVAAEKSVDEAAKALINAGLIKAARETELRKVLQEDPRRTLDMLASCAQQYTAAVKQAQAKQAGALGGPAGEPDTDRPKTAGLNARLGGSSKATAAMAQALLAARG